jgi:site-specific DNA-cytosine methylase
VVRQRAVHICAADTFSQRLVESISREEYEAMAADMYLMSPPCQPVSRSGEPGAYT